ncbi:MAG TPA: pseudouridine synthase [Terracidiphilus sp.]|jgi:23S rRNA pseudouridine2605 synthase|nr:pseudouridine synthase [Terracidiphilus sp.]
MPRKSKKSADTEAEPQQPSKSRIQIEAVETPVAAQPEAEAKKPAPRKRAKKTLPQPAPDATLDLEALHRAPGKSRRKSKGVEANAAVREAAPKEAAEEEAAAQAADTFEEAFEPTVARAARAIAVEANAEPAATEAGQARPETAGGVESGETEEAGDSGEGEQAERAVGQTPGKLERLQKILAAAGVASRRHAEELMTQGRVQVNGKIVTELGSKADASRDHIRVDGKLLHGAERARYFVLNKPRGYVTTVSDPEGRPTVMEFFARMNERLYPVGRLDYLSEGLLLMTNDGELANKLTRAASGVEKTYLVKVSGQPVEAMLEKLREGVGIDRGQPGEGRVRTAPARIRQVRSGDNPWFEVALIEGRNRELRKMFEEIGHHVEKIRRVGYGPLILDLEPGQMRELDSQELDLLRRAAEGKWKPKPIKAAGMLPREAGRAVDFEAGKRRGGKPFRPAENRRGEERPYPAQDRGRGGQQQRPYPAQDRGQRPAYGRNAESTGDRGRGQIGSRPPSRPQERRQDWRQSERPAAPGRGPVTGRGPVAQRGPDRRPAPNQASGQGRGQFGGQFGGQRRAAGGGFGRQEGARGSGAANARGPQGQGSGGNRPFRPKPEFGGERPRFDQRLSEAPRTGKPSFERPQREEPPRRPGQLHIEEERGQRFGAGRPAGKFRPQPSGGFRRPPASGEGRGFGGGSSRAGSRPPRTQGAAPARGSGKPAFGGRPRTESGSRPRPGSVSRPGAESGGRPPAGVKPRFGSGNRGRSGGGPRAGGSRPKPGSRGGPGGKPGRRPR